MLDELAHAGAEHLDAAFVAAYDRKQGAIPALAAEEDVALLAGRGVLHDEATVVDLGAGTGVFVAAVAPHAGRVVAADVSAAMLHRLRARVAASDAADRVEVVRAGLLSYDHAGAPADVVHTRNALHQVPDAFKALALVRMAAMLRPGGVLRLHDLVHDCEPAAFADHLESWFAGAVDDPASGYTRADLAEHVRTEHSTFTWLLEPMLERSGFEIADRSVRRGVYASYTCVRR